MKETPILFSGPMVRAILNGTKPQTRRILPAVYNSPADLVAEVLPPSTVWAGWDAIFSKPGCWGARFHGQPAVALRCPYGQIGDRLWVRETWAAINEPSQPGEPVAAYRADGGEVDRILTEVRAWKSPIFMPRWASRLTLEITDIRVQRLQDISEEDARAEGVEPAPGGWFWGPRRPTTGRRRASRESGRRSGSPARPPGPTRDRRPSGSRSVACRSASARAGGLGGRSCPGSPRGDRRGCRGGGGSRCPPLVARPAGRTGGVGVEARQLAPGGVVAGDRGAVRSARRVSRSSA